MYLHQAMYCFLSMGHGFLMKLMVLTLQYGKRKRILELDPSENDDPREIMKSIWEASSYQGDPAVKKFLELDADPYASLEEWRKALAEALKALDDR